MEYSIRSLSKVIKRVNNSFPAILITGARQTGKTTLLKNMIEEERRYVTFDDPVIRMLAKEDPEGFLQNYPPPVLIDEVQYVPELFSYIKMAIDENNNPGMFWLTGSQQFHLMKNVSDSLAGRVAVFNLGGVSQKEEYGFPLDSKPFIPERVELEERKAFSKEILMSDLFRKIWRGSFPFMVYKEEKEWNAFYSSYVATYLQRDVRDFARVGDENAFIKFLGVAAARSGQLINYADMARDVEVSQPTIKNWLSILEASGLVYFLRPYSNNKTKSMVKTAKLYFLDTGLCSYLSGWNSPESLSKGAASGAFFETYVINELIKTYWNNGIKPPFYFFRNKEKVEIDLIIEQNNTIYPIEIKKTATPSKKIERNFKMIKNHGLNIGQQTVICMKKEISPITRDILSIPVGLI